jgi:hypothetical protein
VALRSGPTVQRLRQERGDQWDFTLQVIDGNGDAYDLSAASVWLTLKALPTDPDPGVLQLTIGNGITVPTPATGEIVIQTAADQTDIDPATYFYDVQIQKSGWNGPKTTQKGQFVVTQDITLSQL